MRRIFTLFMCVILFAQSVCAEEENQTTKEEADGMNIKAPSAILMELSSGQIIYEKDADVERAPASVTKIMTLLLIFDAIAGGQINYDDEVTVSEHAASMGGSQVFLEEGEVQTVDTLVKCISVASANDACVAMAEYISGSEEVFVKQMNDRAKELGMKHTNFVNCNGLDTNGHVTTAYDIALMSKELMSKYPKIQEYCRIWQENITHTTKKGETEFGLTNTNKLIRHYQYATGLKTGSTSDAKFCISATAKKDDIELIAVIMAAEDSKQRNADAVTLFQYGFSKCKKYTEEKVINTPEVAVSRGQKKLVKTAQENLFTYVDTGGSDLNKITRTVEVVEKLDAPVKQGVKAGEAIYYLGDKEIGRVDILTVEDVNKATYKTILSETVKEYILN